jgi:UPF0755 protein
MNLINRGLRTLIADLPNLAWVLMLGLFCIFTVYFLERLGPVASVNGSSVDFEIKSGEGFLEIANNLESEGIIKSSTAFEIFSFLNGSALKFKPGIYRLNTEFSPKDITDILTVGARKEVSIVIREGLSVFEVDDILVKADILKEGELINYSLDNNLEGKLFPDTYRFFTGSDVKEIALRFTDNFSAKVQNLLNKDPKNFERNLILASMIEKEVPDHEERRIVAGLFLKRLSINMPLQIDATICYIKKINKVKGGFPCYPFDPLDFKIDSPYNTYLYTGLPTGAIASPGVSAIEAVLEPEGSPYLFYLSDPDTKKTIFAKTLEEHNTNRAMYLFQN